MLLLLLLVAPLSLQDRDFLLDVVVSAYQRRASQRAAINAMPLYPTEGLLWDTTQIPTGTSSCRALCEHSIGESQGAVRGGCRIAVLVMYGKSPTLCNVAAHFARCH